MTTLPVLGSTAASTAFCSEKVPVSADYALFIDGNAKITAGNGTFKKPKPNAFSLVQIADCPYRTALCADLCYVHNLEQAAPDVHALYKHNAQVIREILSNSVSRVTAAIRLADYIDNNCPDFRWHVSGDVFSYQYAVWIAEVCRLSSNTRHWIYTRSVPYLQPFVGVDNLVVNLSADAENYSTTYAAHRDYGFRICYFTHDGNIPLNLPDDSVIFPDYPLRAGKDGKLNPSMPGYEWFQGLDKRTQRMVCPVDAFGKSEKIRCGPCDRCMV